MKYVALIAGILLGLLFLAASVPVLLHMKMPEPTELPDLAIKFMDVFATSGWMMAVKVCECLGGLLVLVPRTRNLGLLILVPIILNIILVNLLIMGSGPGILGLLVLPAILVIYERKAWLGLVAKNRV
jgi:Na+-driven multidrug efflux pump